MAIKEFPKGSREWMMFADFWGLCRKYWEIKDSKEYWEEFVSDANQFVEKYQNEISSHHSLPKKLAGAWAECLEEEWKKSRSKPENTEKGHGHG